MRVVCWALRSSVHVVAAAVCVLQHSQLLQVFMFIANNFRFLVSRLVIFLLAIAFSCSPSKRNSTPYGMLYAYRWCVASSLRVLYGLNDDDKDAAKKYEAHVGRFSLDLRDLKICACVQQTNSKWIAHEKYATSVWCNESQLKKTFWTIETCRYVFVLWS